MEHEFKQVGSISKDGEDINLLVYQKTAIIYHGTKYFCEKNNEMLGDPYNQMIQIAQLIQQKVFDGNIASSTSKETEIKLKDNARYSLRNLKTEYMEFIRSNKLSFWNHNHRYYHSLNQKHVIADPTYELYRKGIESDNPEVAANVLYSLINDTYHLLIQHLNCIEDEYKKNGGTYTRINKTIFCKRKKKQ